MKNPLLVPELREYLAENQTDLLADFCVTNHPAAVADLLSALTPEETWRILSLADPSVRADIFANLDLEVQVDLAEMLPRGVLAQLFSEMPPDDRVDLFKRMPEDRREAVMPAIAHAEREDIRRLASYAEGTAGSVMTSEYAVLSPDITVSESIHRLRREAPNKETVYYAYVVDENRRLLGFVSLKDLITAPANRIIRDMMHQDMIFARADDDQEDAARKIQKYDLIALPVVNEHDALVGIVTHDDALDIITQEQQEDVEKLMAIAGSHESSAYLRTPAWIHFKNRAIWVVCLAILSLVSGMIIHRFEDTLMRLIILALYMPMLAATGGNTGSQSAAVVIRALALREITPRDIFRVLFKEFQIAMFLALVLGVLAAGRVMFFSGKVDISPEFTLGKIGLAIGAALGIQVITSTLVGAILPLGAARLKMDPAIVASPALATIVDITGLLIYFNIANAILGI